MYEIVRAFGDRFYVKEETMHSVVEDTVKTLVSELPEHARTLEVAKFVISECKSKLRQMNVTL